MGEIGRIGGIIGGIKGLQVRGNGGGSIGGIKGV